MSWRSLMTGSLGIRRRSPLACLHRDGFNHLHTRIFRDFLAVCLKAPQICLNGIAYIPASFLEVRAPRVASRQRRYVPMKRASFVWFDDDAVGVVLHGIMCKRNVVFKYVQQVKAREWATIIVAPPPE